MEEQSGAIGPYKVLRRKTSEKQRFSFADDPLRTTTSLSELKSTSAGTQLAYPEPMLHCAGCAVHASMFREPAAMYCERTGPVWRADDRCDHKLKGDKPCLPIAKM